MQIRVSYLSVASICLLLAFGSNAPATVIWNQGVNGPLSGNPLAPTVFNLAAGTNSIIAQVGGGGASETAVGNQDWVNINIPTGFQFSHLILASFTSSDNNQQGFTGIVAGTDFSGGEAAVNTAASYLGYTHFGIGATNGGQPPTDLVGVDVLPLMGNNVVDSPGSQGFVPPLPAGAYTLLIQNIGDTVPTNYQYDFVVTPVPEPTLSAALLGGSMIMGLRRRRWHR